MSNSKLVNYTKMTSNCTKTRGTKSYDGVIQGVAIHCMAGNLTVEGCGQVFQTRKASAHYGIGSDGRIGQYVDESSRAWCTSHEIDHNLVTIEVANTVAADPWPISDAAYKSLIKLLVDICQRNGIKKLLWQGNKSLMGQWDKQNMVVHRWTAAKACPGDTLYNLHGQIAEEVNAALSAGTTTTTTTKEEDEEVDIAKLLNEMTDEQAYTLVSKAQSYAGKIAEPQWSQKEGAFAKAEQKGALDGTRPEAYVKRDELAAVLDRAGLL